MTARLPGQQADVIGRKAGRSGPRCSAGLAVSWMVCSSELPWTKATADLVIRSSAVLGSRRLRPVTTYCMRWNYGAAGFIPKTCGTANDGIAVGKALDHARLSCPLSRSDLRRRFMLLTPLCSRLSATTDLWSNFDPGRRGFSRQCRCGNLTSRHTVLLRSSDQLFRVEGHDQDTKIAGELGLSDRIRLRPIHHSGLYPDRTLETWTMRTQARSLRTPSIYLRGA